MNALHKADLVSKLSQKPRSSSVQEMAGAPIVTSHRVVREEPVTLAPPPLALPLGSAGPASSAQLGHATLAELPASASSEPWSLGLQEPRTKKHPD